MDIDLTPWCAPESDRRPSLEQPWTVDEWTYASNGQAAIRVASENFVFPLREGFCPPSLQNITGFWRRESVIFWTPLPEAELTEEVMTCPDCDGTGKGPEVICQCCEVSHRCEACEGKKSRPQALPVVTGSGLLAWRYYEMLQALPGVQIGVLLEWADFDDSFIPFRFDLGNGIVRGMSWVEPELRRRACIESVISLRNELLSSWMEGA